MPKAWPVPVSGLATFSQPQSQASRAPNQFYISSLLPSWVSLESGICQRPPHLPRNLQRAGFNKAEQLIPKLPESCFSLQYTKAREVFPSLLPPLLPAPPQAFVSVRSEFLHLVNNIYLCFVAQRRSCQGLLCLLKLRDNLVIKGDLSARGQAWWLPSSGF